jgi:hypothetical protein
MTENKRFKQVTVEDMKKGIKENPVLKKYLDKGINEYGLTEEEALDIMIGAWLGVYE